MSQDNDRPFITNRFIGIDTSELRDETVHATFREDELERMRTRMQTQIDENALRQIQGAFANVGASARQFTDAMAQAFRGVSERQGTMTMSVDPYGRELAVNVNGEMARMMAPSTEFAYIVPILGESTAEGARVNIRAQTAGVELERDVARMETVVNYRVNVSARMTNDVMQDLMMSSPEHGGFAGQPMHIFMEGLTGAVQKLLNGQLSPVDTAQPMKTVVVGAKADKVRKALDVNHRVEVRLPEDVEVKDQELQSRLETAAAKAIEAEANKYVRESRGGNKPKRNVEI